MLQLEQSATVWAGVVQTGFDMVIAERWVPHGELEVNAQADGHQRAIRQGAGLDFKRVAPINYTELLGEWP